MHACGGGCGLCRGQVEYYGDYPSHLSSQREAWWSLFPNKDIPRMESFLNDVVSSFRFPLWAQ